MSTAQAILPQEGIKPDRVQIGHSNVDVVTYEEALDRLVELAETPSGAAQVVTPNAQHVVLLEGDPSLRRIYSEAALVVPDGISLVYAARLLGKPLKGRVTGVDLFHGLCGRAAERGLGVFLLGGRRGAAEEAVAQAILEARPDILFVALGAPKQEYWIHEHGTNLGVPLSIGIGGSFEMVSGITRRAPRWLQTVGLEWLFRLALEPRRLWRRYLIGNMQFLAILLRQMIGSDKNSGAKRYETEGRT